MCTYHIFIVRKWNRIFEDWNKDELCKKRIWKIRANEKKAEE